MSTKEYQLANGLMVIHNHSEGSEMVDVRLSVRAGGFYDFYYNYNSGISHFLEHLTLYSKTKKYSDSNKFKSLIQNCGGLKNGQTGTNKVTFYATVLKEYAEEAFDSVSQTAFHSEFDENTIEKERKIIAEERHSIFKKTENKLRNMFYDMAFKDLGYTYFPIGTEESLANINIQELRKFYNERFTPSGGVLVVSGDINFENTCILVEKYFTESTSCDGTRYIHDDLDPKKIDLSIEKKQNVLLVSDKQSTVILGGIIDGFHNARYFSLLLLLSMLGSGAVSILNKKLREEKKLIYNISTNLLCNPLFGIFEFTLDVQPENIQESLDIIIEEIKKIADGDIDEVDIDLYKKRIKSRDVFDNQSLGSQAELLTRIKMNYSEDIHNRSEYLAKRIDISKEELIDSAKYLMERIKILAVSANKYSEYDF